MAMTTCSECGGDISTKAGRCVHCGTPLKAVQSWDDIIGENILALLFALAAVAMFVLWICDGMGWLD